MSLNINTVLNNIASCYSSKKNNTTTTNSAQYNIFAQQASQLVADYKAKQEASTESDSSSNNNIFGMGYTEIANMSTKDFLNYAYNNEASSGFNSNSTDDSGITLPSIVRYKTQIVSTNGKSFMAVVAKFKGMFPTHTEEQIATELLAKYSENSSSGSSLNMSA